jgi:hypothetical protein
METVYLWPDRPALSLLVLWAISAFALWTAREAMFELIERLGKNLVELCEAGGRWCKASAEALYERSRTALLAAGGLDLQTKLEQEFHRIESGFSERLGQYSTAGSTTSSRRSSRTTSRAATRPPRCPAGPRRSSRSPASRMPTTRTCR